MTEHGDDGHWATLAQREEARAQTLAAACQALDPRAADSFYARRSIESVDGSALPDGAAWQAEYQRARGDYLTGRLEALRARAVARLERGEASRQGLARFGVDEAMLDVTRERITNVGGVDHGLRVELGRD